MIRVLSWVCVLALGCGPAFESDTDTGDSTPDGSTSSSTTISTTGSANPLEGSSSTSQPRTSTSSATGDAPSGSTTASSSSTSGGTCEPLHCAGKIYACTNGEDDDADGLVDLADPECLSPCDDSEDSLDDGLTNGAFDCRTDCYFDGNSGSLDDECRHDLSCDELSPLAPVCTYPPAAGACDLDPVVEDACKTFCEPFVPPGCDCFGCCTVETAEGPENILLLLATEDCSLDNLDACRRCTSQIDVCGNPCEGCEICLGRTEPAEGCDAATCDTGPPCEDSCDCPDGGYCVLGCCHPAPPG